MTISYREFFTALIGCRLLDQELQHVNTEAALWEQYRFDEKGAHYIEPEERWGWPW